MYVIKDLIKLVKCEEDLLSPFENIHPHIVEFVVDCKATAFNSKVVSEQSLQQIEYVLVYLHDHLNLGKWDEVLEHKRQAFTSASYLKTLIILKLHSSLNEEKNVLTVKNALQIIDKGFLLGLPLRNHLTLLTDCASLLSKYINVQRQSETHRLTHDLQPPLAKKIKTNESIFNNNSKVDIVSCPTIEFFQNNYFNKQKPVIIKDCMTIWPAMTKWQDINYLLDIGGERTVPIELGSSYSSEDFSQKLMTLREFVTKYYNAKDGEAIGYLAQHDLLSQIPELINDIKTPDYCCLNRVEEDELVEPEINAWLGPKGTVSSLHHDPKDNLLCQVHGAKQIIMFAPSDTQYLYVHDDMPMLSNTSQVDPTNPDLASFPKFTSATLHACVLHAGEMLYIPPTWWHHVTALEKSFSVNFWWK